MSQLYNIKGVNGDIEINLGKEALDSLDDAHSCLVIPCYNDSYVMTYHPKRKGWEFPAGTREGDESIIECAKRETFEEIGAILKDVQPVGYYIVNGKNINLKTAIFISKVEKFEPKPRWSETDLVKLFDQLPENISYKDDVYKIILEYIK